MTTTIKAIIIGICLTLAGVCATAFYYDFAVKEDTNYDQPEKTDTIVKTKYEPPKVLVTDPILKPAKVYVYQKPDTALYNKIKNEPRVVSMKITKHNISFDKIDTAGFVNTEKFNIDPSKLEELTLLPSGKIVAKKKKGKNRAIKWIAGILVVTGIVVLVAKK